MSTVTAAQQKTFTYKARTRDGRVVEGKIKALTDDQVRSEIFKRNMVPVAVSEQSGLQRDFSFGSKRVKLKEVGAFMTQFATMVNAGLPIIRGLKTLAKQQSNPTLKAAIQGMEQSINNGSTFADAVAKYPLIFSPLMIAMIRAGERGGFLAQVLNQVSHNIASDVELRGKIKSAMTYPVAILILAVVIVIAMLLFIVPVFQGLFKSLGGQLPLPTQILVAASDFLKVGIIPLIIAVVAFTIWYNRNKHKESIRSIIDPIKVKAPIFGNLVQKLVAARFARNFGSLLDSGMTVIPVLDIVGSTSGSIIVERALYDVKAQVQAGQPVAPQLERYPIFPPMLVDMLSIGEEAGDIPGMMLKIADAYDAEVKALTDSLSSLIEPLMLVVLGALVGSIVIALYMPIFSIYDQIKK